MPNDKCKGIGCSHYRLKPKIKQIYWGISIEKDKSFCELADNFVSDMDGPMEQCTTFKYKIDDALDLCRKITAERGITMAQLLYAIQIRNTDTEENNDN